MTPIERTELVDAWIRLQLIDQKSTEQPLLKWAATKLWRIGRADPTLCFALILDLLEKSSDEVVVSNVAAGPLEDLLVNHGESMIDQIIAMADVNDKLASALQGVWHGRLQPSLVSRLKQ